MNLADSGSNPAPFAPPTFPGDEERAPARGGEGGCWKGCVLGCLGVFVLSVVGTILGGWYLYHHGLKLAAPFLRDMTERSLKEVTLPQEEKAAILAQVDRLVAATKEGRVTWTDLIEALETLEDSPLLGAWAIYAAETHYVQPAQISDEEKEAARRVLQRLLHGLHDKTITLEQLQPLESLLIVDDGHGKQRLKEQLTDEELQAFVAKCREIADAAGVADEPFEVTISQELQTVVDGILNEAQPPAEQPIDNEPTPRDAAE